MGVICTDPPPPQDSPPPKEWRKMNSLACGLRCAEEGTQPHPGMRRFPKSCHLSTPLHKLCSSSELKTPVQRERVLQVEVPLSHLLPSKSTLISLATLWVNILLRKVVKIKHLSWGYVLHILNGEAASLTFDDLFKMSIQSSREDVATQVFSSVLQNESLQHELFNFLKMFAQMGIVKVGVLPLQHLELTISSDIIEASGLRIEFESLMNGEYERVLKVHTIPDSSEGPPLLTAYLTVLVDHVQISEKPSGNSNGVNLSLENCKHQHTPHAASREESITMEELQARKCLTLLTSTTDGAASKGSKDPCMHAVKHANKKPQALKKDPATGDQISSTADDQNHGDVTKFESSTTAQPKAVDNKHMHDPGRYKPEEIKKDSNCKFTDIQDFSFNLSTICTETESATSPSMYSGVAENPELPDSVRKETNYPCEASTSHHKPPHSSTLTPPLPHAGEKSICLTKQETECTTVYQVETGASCAAELLQHYFFKAVRGEGGADFLSQLLDLRDCHCPHLDLNFGSSESSRTPWWYLVYSTNDVNAMIRVLQALREHSIEFESLLTHTDGEKNLIEEAMEKNKALFNKIQRFAKWQHSEEDQSALDRERLNIPAGSPETQSRSSSYSFQAVAGDELSSDILPLEKTTIHVQEQNFDSNAGLPFSAGEPPNIRLQPIQTGSLAELPKGMSQSSSESFSDGGMTSLDADDSSDGKKHKKSMPGTVHVLTQIPEAKRSVPGFNDSPYTSRPSQLQSWNTVLKNCSSLLELKSFIQSQPPEVLTLKDAVQGKTLCHALVGLIDEGFTSSKVIHLLESFEKESLRQCMACQDSSGNTPLHCSMDVPNDSSGIVEYLLRYTSHEPLLIMNNDNLTPLELSFERKLGSIFKMLLHHHIRAGASCDELFKQYVLKATKKEEGACFLSPLLDLRDRHCPDLDLNFGSSESSRTPWWYLVNSTTDVNAMTRVLQALRKHSIKIESLLTHTDGEKNLIEEAMEKNKALFNMIQRFAGSQHSEEDQGAPNKERSNSSDLGEESMGNTFNMINIAEWPPIREEDHITHDKERLSVSGSEIRPQKTPSYPSPPSKMASDRSSSDPQFEQVACRGSGGVPIISDGTVLSSPTLGPSQPHSWRTDIYKNNSSLASLNSFIQSLPPEVLTLKDTVQGKTLCHTLVCLCDEGFTSSDVIHLLELFEEHFLQQCMACRDFSGNTPLHCSVDVRNTSTETVKFLLKFTSHESLLIVNNDNVTALKLSFEKEFWSITQLLIEHQIETGTCAAELLQQYILKAVKEEGGGDFLSQLLDLREHYCPDLNLNFGSCGSSRTPWWYLVNCKDVTVMNRVLKALKDHSIDFKSLLTRIDGETNLVDEAQEKNKTLFIMIQRIAGLQHIYSEEDQGAPVKEGLSISGTEAPSQTSTPTTSLPKFANDQPSSHQGTAKFKQVQDWLSQCDSESLAEGTNSHMQSDSSSTDQCDFPVSSEMETGDQRLPNKIFRSTQPKTAVFRHISSSESEVECIGNHKFSHPAQRSFPAVAGDEEREVHLNISPLERNTTHVQQHFETTTELPPSGEPSNIELQPAQSGLQTQLLSELSEDMSQSSSESLSEGGMTSLDADASSDDGAGRTLPKAKRHASKLHRKCKKATPTVHSVPLVTSKGKKSSLVILHQQSGYSGDDSDHKYECKRFKSSKFTRAQRAAGITRKKQLNSSSTSECSEEEIDEHSAQIWNAENGSTNVIKFSIPFTCDFSTNHLLLVSNSTSNLKKASELHHVVRRQCLKSVKRILSCDGGEEMIQTMDEKGCTPLEIVSQRKDLELLLKNLFCSDAFSSVTLQTCDGLKVTLMSLLHRDIFTSMLHWLRVGCQRWELELTIFVYAAPAPDCFRAGTKKKKNIKNSQEVAAQEQEAPFQSELVSDTREFDILVFYRSAGINSLVTGITQNQCKTRTPNVTPLNQRNPPSDSSVARMTQHSINPTISPGATDSTQSLAVADSPSYSQPKSSAIKLSTPKQVSDSINASPWLLGKARNEDTSPRSQSKVSDEEVTAWQAWVEKAVDCLHAGYYSQMLEVLKFGKVLPSLPPEIAMAVQFGYALAYYKLDKHSEAAKHLESLKTIAASAQSCGNESIASVYLGDIEFTQSRYTEAAKHYSHALELYKGDDNVGKEYRLVVPTFSAISAKLGSAFRNASKIVDAVQAYRQAIATADSKKDRLSAHTSLGNLFQSVGENASALAEYEHSIRLSDELRDYISLGWAYGNMGNAYLGLYQRDKGLNYLMKALDLTVEHEPTPQAISRAFNNLGTAYQALNELDKAEENYDLALSQSIYGNDLPGQARVYGNIGNVLMLRKDYERAIPHYTEVLHLSRDRSTVSTAFHNRGCSYYEWAESRKATLFQKDDSSVKKDQFFLSGPDFKDCEVEHQPPVLPNSILKYYQQGRQDLEEVVKYHEETFDNIKGSSKGLTLSVSLFETNSRTFHRLQDCLVNLGEWEKALVVAEQSRTRTLGELLVKRKGWQIDDPLTAPLNLDSISDIVKSQQSIVVYLSYTGARLLGWVLAPKSSKVSVNMFEVPLEDDQFEGKSFDYHLRYSLTEVLVERNFEMYRAVDYQSELNEPVRKLYRLVGRPLMKIFKELRDPDSTPGVQDIVIIPDSYTNLIPFPCLLAGEDGVDFLGDNFSFRIMPSLLTMGIVDQLPSVVVQVPADSQNMCVVGNPTVPTFVYNNEKWSLGKLPFATREAEWVASTLKTTPILHEQATKNAVLMRIMNAKVIHMATHGSASAGFLALAGMSSRNEAAEAKSILLYPEDVESLNISPALVVLSSCDSGRGMVKADGILGMARAFILAGAQAVLTTLWRVPDESASIFMQFFYQYLIDGLKASLALQKATLSLRCFSKYSQYIHWSGYQLTGREIQFDITTPSTAAALEARLGKSSVFPRLEVVKQLESAFLRDPHTPSDVQILRGSPGVKPSEPLIDFIHSFHHAFKGGIFWINGRRQELIDASADYIKQVTWTVPTASQTHPTLIIFDYIDQIPRFSNPATSLMTLLRNPNTHIVVISKNYAPPDDLLKEVDHQLLRGCKIIDVEPLSMIHTTQRIVHSILNVHHLAPTNEDQNIFEKLAEFTSGSPVLTDVATALLLSEMKHGSQNKPRDIHDTLVNFEDQLCLDEMGPSTKPVTVVRHEPPKGTALVREISKNVHDHIDSIKETGHDPWCTSSTYDSWQAVAMLVDQCSLTAEEKLLLFAVSMFSCSPIPMRMVTEVSLMIAKASQKPHISTSLHSKLFQMHVMKRYPLPVILHQSLDTQKQSTDPEFVYMPQYITRAIWKDMMSPGDKVMALSTSFMALRTLADNTSSSDTGFLGGLSSLLLEVYELNYALMGKKCYQEVYKLYLRFHVEKKQQPVGAAAAQIQFSDPP